jgi:PAT family beta-lactamase induction signal transducer AmpG
MVFAVHLPDLVFVYLSQAQPQNFYLVCAFLAIEQFGYGFGFTAMMLYMIMVVRRRAQDGALRDLHRPDGARHDGAGHVERLLQEYLGYQHFFIWVCLATIPAFIMAALVKIDPEFGKK